MGGRPIAAVQAAGCFLQLVFGALLAVGALHVAPEAVATIGEGRTRDGLRLLAFWIGGPAAGIALTAWLVRGLKPRGGPDKGPRP
jgi:hypothetical protein